MCLQNMTCVGISDGNISVRIQGLTCSCQALSDIPAVMFAEELVKEYDNAKVILTTRSVDSWCNSMMRTVCNPRYYSRLFRLAAWFDKRKF